MMNYKKTKKQVTTLITIAALTLLTISSTLFMFSSSTTTTVKAAIPSNLLQYEWTLPAGDNARSFFSAGPAPNAPNIQWKTEIPYVSGYPVAFNGMVFVQPYGSTIALDGATGDIVWNAVGTSGGMCKIDDTYMLIGSTCVKIADGTTVWVGPSGFSTSAYGVIGGVDYIPELKMLVDTNYGWNLPDPSQPPTLAWNRTAEHNIGPGLGGVYGEGIFVYGSSDYFLRGINATTGELIWTSPASTSFVYGMSYADGKVFHGGLDNNMRAWDIQTGELLWTYNPGTWYGQWASATGVAYGMVYEHNQDNYVYAINATNGELVWRTKGPGIGYSNTLSIADGKVYVQMGENQYRDFETGEYAYSEYCCYDAYTGELIWSLPMENGAPFNLQCIAYGNLYVIPNKPTPQEPGVWTYNLGGAMGLGEVWCISSEVTDWPMFLHDPEHSAEGAGPTNLALKWKFTAGAQVVSSPTLADGVCYFGSFDSNIYAIDANSGTEIWTFETGFPVASSVAVVNGKVYTGADDGNIYCLNAATGAKLWETYAGGKTNSIIGGGLQGPTRSSPMVIGSRVYVGALDGNIYCLNANTGSIIWQFQTGGEILSTPTIVGNAIYCTSSTPPPNGILYKLDANSGTESWNFTFPYELQRTLGSGGFTFASPTVAEGMVFVRNGLLWNYALNDTTGETIWIYEGKYNPGTPFQSGGVVQCNAMLYVRGRLYFNDFYGITCLNPANGSIIWHSWLSRESIAQGVAYAYGRLYTVTEMRCLYVLDEYTGEKLSFYDQFGSQMHSMPSLYNGSLYVGCCDWGVYCFGDARFMSSAEPAPSASISASQSMPLEAESEELSVASGFTSTDLAIIAVVAIAVVIGIAAYWTLRKQE